MAYFNQQWHGVPHSTEVEVISIYDHANLVLVRRADGLQLEGPAGPVETAEVHPSFISDALPRPTTDILAEAWTIAARNTELSEEKKRRIAELTKQIDDEQRAERHTLSARSNRLSTEEQWAIQRSIVAHPLEGRKVKAEKSTGYRGRGTKTVYGIIETRRETTVMPDNIGIHSRPAMGKPFVRLLKADGTPGIKIETFYGDMPQGWTLVENAA